MFSRSCRIPTSRTLKNRAVPRQSQHAQCLDRRMSDKTFLTGEVAGRPIATMKLWILSWKLGPLLVRFCRAAERVSCFVVGAVGLWAMPLRCPSCPLRYADGREARIGIGSGIAFYNGRRPHQALGDRPPMAVWHAGSSEGSQFAGTAFTRVLPAAGIRISHGWPWAVDGQRVHRALWRGTATTADITAGSTKLRGRGREWLRGRACSSSGPLG
jgi:hypothetical protein